MQLEIDQPVQVDGVQFTVLAGPFPGYFETFWVVQDAAGFCTRASEFEIEEM